MTKCRCHCGTSLRRQRVLESNADMGGGLEINGIDFVEVLDSGAPAGMAQKLLDVAFLKPDGVAALNEDNFAVTGGTRVKGIKVLSLALQPDGLTQRLTLDQAGDFSPYVLSLRQGAVNAAPPANMDRQRRACASPSKSNAARISIAPTLHFRFRRVVRGRRQIT